MGDERVLRTPHAQKISIKTLVDPEKISNKLTAGLKKNIMQINE